MFSKNLLSYYTRKGYIHLKYLDKFDLAEEILSIFKKCKNKSYKEIKDKLRLFEKGKNDYKIVRALTGLLLRKSEFIPNTALNSKIIREKLFDFGFVIDDYQRNKIVTKIATEFNVSENTIEDAFFADLPQEQILNKFELDEVTPEDLIKNYNSSLTQTLLFYASEISIIIEDNFQQVFRMINYFGLMYQINNKKIKINGPASLFKNTMKYGKNLAKLLGFIIVNEKWSIEAKIQMKKYNENKIFSFNLNSKDNVLFPCIKKIENTFDSEIEKQFFNDFKIFATEWKIKREPTYIKAGNYVIIPDFGFYKNGIELYLEIVGFWTPEYIEKKIKKFNQSKTKIIVALNQKLKCSSKDFPGDVIFYKDRIPMKKILNILKREEEKEIQLRIADNSSIELHENIVDITSKAKELDLNPEVIKRLLPPDYFIIGKKIISSLFLTKLKDEIGNKRKYSEIHKILEKYQLTNKVLDLIGFKIFWNGLEPIKIIPKKRDNKNILNS
ncbi:MAG: DUF790 family protein [Candidatus Lokiarchaeota archaeon]|nr:DUF790 family protein [Candidatus Lokiarchaeota archaeon]